MDAERVRIEVAEHIADVRLTRADKHNGIDWRMFVALNEAIESLRAEPGVRCVVLSGEGPSFCAGLDFKSFIEGNGDLAGDGFAPVEGSAANFAQRVAYGWRELELPVIAALSGACIGGGLQIALAADIRIAAPDARLSVMEIAYGLVPDMSLSQSLTRLVRDDIARELTYTGRLVEAAEALELGLVTRIDDEPLRAATALATEIAGRSPDAIRRAKRLANETPKLSAADGLALEASLQRELLGSPNQLAAVQATLAKQPAEFADPV
ncbi:MAG TPA: crotonase/enoyl-CoA hydratase family protein [Solirubrobacterales bacterium]|nr:crotonase/enoyl-CoA hydratase family protein [Solirubrobacterales bacterium]